MQEEVENAVDRAGLKDSTQKRINFLVESSHGGVKSDHRNRLQGA